MLGRPCSPLPPPLPPTGATLPAQTGLTTPHKTIWTDRTSPSRSGIDEASAVVGFGQGGVDDLNSVERAMMNNPVRAALQHHREATWFRRLADG